MIQTLEQKIRGILAFYALWQLPVSKEKIEDLLGQELPDEILNTNFVQYLENTKEYYSVMALADWKKRKEEADFFSRELQQKAERFARLFCRFPFVRAIALANTAAMGTASRDSDIDLFIVTKPGRIWTARFFLTFFCAFLGLRAGKKGGRGKICLSFFVAENSADFSNLKREQDVYLAFWCVTLQPLSGREFFEKFYEQNRSWISEEFGLDPKHSFSSAPMVRRFFWQRVSEWFLLPFWEKIFKKLLLKKAQRFLDPHSPEYCPDIILNDRMQKLHHPDRRKEIREEWKKL